MNAQTIHTSLGIKIYNDIVKVARRTTKMKRGGEAVSL